MKSRLFRFVRLSALYGNATAAALLIGVWLTFPYDALRARVISEAQGRGVGLSVRSAGPGFGGVRLSQLKLYHSVAAMEAGGEALNIDSVSIRPSLFPPGIHVHVAAMAGSISVTSGMWPKSSLTAQWRDIDVAKGNFAGFTGVNAVGTFDGEIQLSSPRQPGVPAGTLDLVQAVGKVSFLAKNLTVQGGTIAIPGGALGTDLPKVALGNISLNWQVDKSVATCAECATTSSDLELQFEGTAKLGKALCYSDLALKYRLKADPAFLKELGIIAAALSRLSPDPADPAWRTGVIGGYLCDPRLR